MSNDLDVRRPVYGHPDYTIDGNGNIFNTEDKRDTIKELNQSADLVKLAFISHMGYPTIYLTMNELLDNIQLYDLPEYSTRKCWNGKWAILKTPILIADGERLCPNFPRYTVTEKGVVRDIRTGKMRNVYTITGGYPAVDIYCPMTNAVRAIAIHRLVAEAWVCNPNPMLYAIVNHIDSDVTNLKLDNLEWVTQSDNVEHGIQARNWTTTKFVRIYDNDNRVEIGAHTVQKTRNITGYTAFRYTELQCGLYDGKLFSGRYLTKTPDDKTEWVIKTHTGMCTGPYEATKLDTGDVVAHRSLKGLAAITGVHWGNIRRAILDGGRYIYNGYKFRQITDNWVSDEKCIENPQKRSRVQIFVDNGPWIVTNSVRETARCIPGLTRRILLNRLDTGKSWGKYKFKYV